MRPSRFVLWEVDAQEDFMLPDGKLYVPGAEKIIPNIRRLVGTAARTGTLLVSSACAHSENDPEFKTFPPHCIKGTTGARIIREGMRDTFVTIPSDPAFRLSADALSARQLVIEKQMLDVFSNPHTAAIVERLGSNAEHIVFGVVTEYCVACAARGLLERGRRVHIVSDAIETINIAEGRRALGDLVSRGAQMIDTERAIALLRHAHSDD